MGELLAYVSAFSLLSIQIALQHRTQVRQQERLLRNQLKLDLYREFVLLIREASTAHAELSAWNTSLRSQVAGSVAVMKEHGTWIPLRYDLVDFWPLRERLSASIVAVIAQLEQYEIVHPGLRRFRLLFSQELGKLLKAGRDLEAVHREILPQKFEDKEGQARVIEKGPVSKDNEALLQEAEAEWSEVASDTCAYLLDLQTELQGELLGDLFDHKLPKRQPQDPSFQVMTLQGLHPTQAGNEEDSD